MLFRNLAELNHILDDKPYSQYIVKQADSNYDKNRNIANQYG